MATFRDRIEAFVADAREKAQGGFTLAELSELFDKFVEIAVAEAKFLQLPGAEKKAYVLAAIGYLFDAVAPAIPLGYLRLVSWLVLPVIRATVLVLADRAIERIYRQTPAPTPAT